MKDRKCRVWDIKKKRMYSYKEISSINNNGIIMIVADNNDWMIGPGDYILMDFTGREDREENDLYDKDILKSIFTNAIYLIEWDDQGAGFKLVFYIDGEPSDSMYYNRYDLCSVDDMMIKIGNFFENPDILKEKIVVRKKNKEVEN